MPPEGVNLDENSILDISHESLMRVWERLGTWVQEEADAADLYHRITESALLYEQEKAGLWRDPDLQIALDWNIKNDPNAAWASQYNQHFTAAKRFIQASENEKKFVLADKARRRKITQGALISFLLVLSALSIWAFTERNNSIQNAQAAIAEKLEADKQKKVAEEQTVLAEANYKKAKVEEKRAQDQQLETAKQRELALQRAEEARLAKIVAEEQGGKAILAKKAADRDRQIAENQKVISDSLRFVSEKSEKKATRLRILALAQNLAIKSKLADKNTYTQQVKALLALQAHTFNKRYGGNTMDAEVFGALFSAIRVYQSPKEYVSRLHKDEVKSICISSANGDLASTGADGFIIIQPESIEKQAIISGQQMLIFDNLVYNDKGDQLAVSCDDYSLKIYSSSNVNDPIANLEKIHPAKIMAIEWRDNQLVTACLDSNIRVIDINKEEVIATYKIKSRPLSIDLHNQTGKLVVGCADGSIYQLSLSGDKSFKLLKNLSNNVRINCISISGDGSKVVVGTSSGSCYIISTNDGSTLGSLSGHNGGITHVRFHPTSGYIATACLDNKVRLYPTYTQGVQPIVFNEHDSWVWDVVFHPNKDVLASSSRDKTVRTYPISADAMATYLMDNINRNFTKEEWVQYIGEDVDYEKLNPKLP